MTNEEAINMVQGARQYLTAGNPIWDAKKIDEAMKMAIEALLREEAEANGYCHRIKPKGGDDE